jgi:hypothetical protein
MNPQAKANGNPPRKPAKPVRDQARIVEAMAAKGMSADIIAACLNMGRNELRGRHALSLHNGREKAKKQKAEIKGGDLTYAEMCAADSILSSSASEWFGPVYGNLLWARLDGGGGGAKTPAQAFARFLRDGARFSTVGVDKDFAPERIVEFRALKIEAQKLLKQVEARHSSPPGQAARTR